MKAKEARELYNEAKFDIDKKMESIYKDVEYLAMNGHDQAVIMMNNADRKRGMEITRRLRDNGYQVNDTRSDETGLLSFTLYW